MVESTEGISTEPNESSKIAAYRVTAQLLVCEAQLIWRRTSIFVALNALVASGLKLMGTIDKIDPWLGLVVSAVALVYCIFWHFSMSRIWTYHHYYIALMREQEAALKLTQLGLGVKSRGKPLTEGCSDRVGGEEIKFGRAASLFKGKTVAGLTTALFCVVHLLMLVGFLRLLRPAT